MDLLIELWPQRHSVFTNGYLAERAALQHSCILNALRYILARREIGQHY